MRYLLLILTLFLGLAASAQLPYYKIVKSSFNDSTTISLGSQQWVDISVDTTYSAPDTLFIDLYIGHNQSCQYTGDLILFKVSTVSFHAMALNADHTTRHIGFTMPATWDCADTIPFTLGANSWGQGGSFVRGLFYVPTTGISEITPNMPVASRRYFNFDGQLTESLSGLVIEELTYANGMVTRSKKYITAQ